MKTIQLMLVPAPGQAPQALATLKVLDPSPSAYHLWNQVYQHSKTVVLEGYTRDGYAWKPNRTFTHCAVQSTDGRQKLPGFLKYLKERQKSAYGRFLVGSSTGLWVVSFVQKKFDAPDCMECRICLDVTQIAGCPLSAQAPPKAKLPPSSAATAVPPKSSKPAPKRGAGAGFLSKLVGAQQRTNQHVMASAQPKKPPPSSDEAVAMNGSSSSTTTATNNTDQPKTATQVLNDFRSEMQQKMLDFDTTAESEMKIFISLSKYTANLASEEEYAKVTMDILKYLVHEAAEEVNEAWVAHKEPSEFMDEVTIVVYKEDCVPPEVLEEINRGELTEEMKAQQRQQQLTSQRQKTAAERKRDQALEVGAHSTVAEEDDAEDVTVLNMQKRDRRTIEDYGREKKKARA